MIVRVGDRAFEGGAVDLAAVGSSLDPRAVATAVREGRARRDGTVVTVEARETGALHERVGCVTPTATLQPRTALAVAARSRGWTTPVDDDLARARERLDDVDLGDTADATGVEARRTLARAEDEVARLRERVAEARGRVQARRDQDANTADDADAALTDAVRALSEVETAAAAAREERRAARAEARAVRDRLADRLALEDEVANLERRARAHLVDRARDAYESALSSVPELDGPADPFDAPPDAAALAVARVGDLAAPVVVACGRFDTACAATRWLDAPAIRLDP